MHRIALLKIKIVFVSVLGGFQRYPKVLILQKYYNLSEEETEFQILDRFSFQRFLGLSVSDKVPDKNTIWLFKQRLGIPG